jgi:hypothetical protein
MLTPRYPLGLVTAANGKIYAMGGDNVGTIEEATIATNRPPTADARGPYPVAEGGSIPLSGSGTDPDPGDTLAYAWDLDNNGSFETPGQTATFSAAGRDGPSSQALVLQVCDNHGACATSPTTVNIANARPAVMPPAGQSADEGTAKSFNLGSFADPGPDSPWTVDVDWGDGSPHTSFTVTAPGALPAQSHTYADNGSYTVAVKVTDKDSGESDPGRFNVTANNIPPSNVSAAPSPASINENESTTVTGSFADPGTLDPHTVVITWGDGSPNTSLNLLAGTLTFSATHQYLDNPSGQPTGSFSIGVTVTDKDGGSGTGSATVQVRNVAPTVAAISGLPVAPVSVSAAVNGSASFTDPGTKDTHTAVWDWGDGTTSPGTVTETNGSGSVAGSHTYATAGVYTVKVTVTDKDGGVGQALFQYVVAYDPNGGFVTGGGWITSPAGAYTANPALTGKANFGFVSKYQRGANVPTGQTEFQFQVANLNFRGTAYEWLVVAGARAQHKGTGRVNGTGNYGFLLTAIDGDLSGGGGADKFRIKIWDKSNNDALVYDNQLNAPDGADPTTTLGGGSIVIHK